MTPERRRWTLGQNLRLTDLIRAGAEEAIRMLEAGTTAAELHALAEAIERRRVAILAEPPPWVQARRGADTIVGKESR